MANDARSTRQRSTSASSSATERASSDTSSRAPSSTTPSTTPASVSSPAAAGQHHTTIDADPLNGGTPRDAGDAFVAQVQKVQRQMMLLRATESARTARAGLFQANRLDQANQQPQRLDFDIDELRRVEADVMFAKYYYDDDDEHATAGASNANAFRYNANRARSAARVDEQYEDEDEDFGTSVRAPPSSPAYQSQSRGSPTDPSPFDAPSRRQAQGFAGMAVREPGQPIIIPRARYGDAVDLTGATGPTFTAPTTVPQHAMPTSNTLPATGGLFPAHWATYTSIHEMPMYARAARVQNMWQGDNGYYTTAVPSDTYTYDEDQ